MTDKEKIVKISGDFEESVPDCGTCRYELIPMTRSPCQRCSSDNNLWKSDKEVLFDDESRWRCD